MGGFFLPMTDLPWFPFYVDDFMGSPKVRRMDATDIGIYLALLIEQWQLGSVSEDAPAELATALRTECERIETVLTRCFDLTDDGWVNRRLERIRAEQVEKSEKARRSALKRWDKKPKKQAGPDANALRTQSERNAIQNQNQIQTDTDISSNGQVEKADREAFERLWALAKGRGAKQKAWEVYRRVVPKKIDAETVHRAREAHVRAASDVKYVKHLERWLRDGRWTDAELPPPKASGINYEAARAWRES